MDRGTGALASVSSSSIVRSTVLRSMRLATLRGGAAAPPPAATTSVPDPPPPSAAAAASSAAASLAVATFCFSCR